jgi:serine/threonine-protein kinase
MDQLLGGRYQFIRVLESNAFGQTYLAEDLRADNQAKCVVKRLQVNSKNPRTQRFVSILLKKKAETLSGFTFEQTPKILNFFEDPSGFYLVEEYIDGVPLSEAIAESSPMEEDKVASLIQEILEVLLVVHGWGVIHRCLKPENLIRRFSDQKLVLIGFGIFKEISAQVMRSQQPTGQAAPSITSAYLPPEHTQGPLQFNSDIYAAGMIGVHALTGLSEGDLFKLRSLTTNGAAPPRLLWREKATVSSSLADIIDRMIHPNASQRYQMVADALNDIKRFVQGEEIQPMEMRMPSESPPTVLQRPMPQSSSSTSSKPWLTSVLLVVAVLLGAGALMYSQLPQKWLAQRSLQRAEGYRNAEAFDEAIAQYDQALELYPNGETYYERAMLYGDIGNTQAALEDLANAIAQEPDNSEFHYQRANLRFRVGDDSGAIADYTAAIEHDPSNARAYVNRGTVRAETGDDLGAVEDYTEAIQVDPNLSAAYLNRCLSRSNLGNHQDAISDCSKAIDLQPNSVLAYQNRGLVRRRIGDTAGAIEDFNIAIQLDPDDPDPYYNRGLARYELGDRMGAIADYTEAIRRNSNHVFAYYDRGLLYVEDGDTEAAIADFRRAATLCLDSGRTACYEDAQFQLNQLRNVEDTSTANSPAEDSIEDPSE